MVVHLFAAVLLGVSLLGAPPDLDVGDAAPDLAIANWVKGDAVDLASFEGKKVAVVEFWATWCGPCKTSIPHLTELQKQFADDDVVVIGVSSGEKLGTVKDFVEDWGKKMDYTVAWDDEGKTYDAWVKAAGENGIPTAFVVDKKGKVAWIGHPMSGLGKAIEGVLEGTHPVENETRSARRRMMQVQRAFLTHVMNEEYGKAADVGEKIYEAISEKPTDLNNFAWRLMTDDPYEGHFNELALKMAIRSNELTEGETWFILDTLALAKFLSGNAEAAVELETKSIRLAKKAGIQEEQIVELKKALMRFSSQKKKKRKVY